MLIIPLRFVHPLASRPIVSWIIVLLCVFFFWRQTVSEEKQIVQLNDYCASEAWQDVKHRVELDGFETVEDCVYFNSMLMQVYDQNQLMYYLNGDGSEEPDDESEENYPQWTMDKANYAYWKVHAHVQTDLTFRMAQRSLDWVHPRALFAQFAHGDFWHLFFNLIFFVAFAVAVEAVIGPMKLLLLLLVCSFVDGVAYSFFSWINGHYSATLGLSGFVSAVMSALWYLLPKGRIRTLVFVPVPLPINIPVWMLSGLFFVWDVMALPEMLGESNVNHLAHVIGAVCGYGMAWYWFSEEKAWLNETMDLELARSWHRQLD